MLGEGSLSDSQGEPEVFWRVNVRDAKFFRSLAYPPAVANSGHSPYFSMNNPEAWIPPKAFEAYERWTLRCRAREEQAREEGRVCEKEMGPEYFDVNILQISAYREFYFVPRYRDLHYFSVDNIEEWWMPEAFRVMNYYEPVVHRSRSRASSTTSQSSSSLPSRMSTPVSDTSAGLSEAPSAPPSSPEPLLDKRERETINVSSGSSDDETGTAPAVPSKRRRKKRARKVKAESDSEIEIVSSCLRGLSKIPYRPLAQALPGCFG